MNSNRLFPQQTKRKCAAVSSSAPRLKNNPGVTAGCNERDGGARVWRLFRKLRYLRNTQKSDRRENRKSSNPSLFFNHLSFLFIASLKLWRSRLSRVMYSMANCLLLMKVGAWVCVSLWVWVSQRSLMPGWWWIHSEIPTD